jgi:hypothetical protein
MAISLLHMNYRRLQVRSESSVLPLPPTSTSCSTALQPSCAEARVCAGTRPGIHHTHSAARTAPFLPQGQQNFFSQTGALACAFTPKSMIELIQTVTNTAHFLYVIFLLPKLAGF